MATGSGIVSIDELQIKDLSELINHFRNLKQNPNDHIKSHFEKLRGDIKSRFESLHNELNKLEGDLIDKVNSMEEDCHSKADKKVAKLKVDNNQISFERYLDLLDISKINENTDKNEKLFEDILLCERATRVKTDEINSFIFKDNYFRFKKSSIVLDKNFAGSLVEIDPDYLKQDKNGVKLLAKKTKYSFSKFHFLNLQITLDK
jgi:hypothetical protein